MPNSTDPHTWIDKVEHDARKRIDRIYAHACAALDDSLRAATLAAINTTQGGAFHRRRQHR